MNLKRKAVNFLIFVFLFSFFLNFEVFGFIVVQDPIGTPRISDEILEKLFNDQDQIKTQIFLTYCWFLRYKHTCNFRYCKEVTKLLKEQFLRQKILRSQYLEVDSNCSYNLLLEMQEETNTLDNFSVIHRLLSRFDCLSKHGKALYDRKEVFNLLPNLLLALLDINVILVKIWGYSTGRSHDCILDSLCSDRTRTSVEVSDAIKLTVYFLDLNKSFLNVIKKGKQQSSDLELQLKEVIAKQLQLYFENGMNNLEQWYEWFLKTGELFAFDGAYNALVVNAYKKRMTINLHKSI